MKRLLYLTILMLTIVSAGAETISDMGRAREWCDATMLQGIEGIWEFPDDETRVLIRREAGYDNRYEIIVVESPDTRLMPGDKIGWLKNSPISTKYDMGLYRERRNGILTSPGHCLAELNKQEDAMIVKGKTVKISLNMRYLLSSFWRSIKLTYKDPTENLPYGLVRIYPVSDKKHAIDYL